MEATDKLDYQGSAIGAGDNDETFTRIWTGSQEPDDTSCQCVDLESQSWKDNMQKFPNSPTIAGLNQTQQTDRIVHHWTDI